MVGEPERPNAHSIPLWPADAERSFHPWLDRYLLAGGVRGAVLICPGGGYHGRARHEGIQVAQRFNQAGLHAFVVHYSVAPQRHPQPLRDAARALDIIRRHSSEWGVQAQSIALCGFSAGGHLAASLGVHFASSLLADLAPPDARRLRPDALILGYPVISTGEFGHSGSVENLLGPSPDHAQRQQMSLEHHVDADTPPTFLWHTAADASVPVENSLLFARALSTHAIPFELHIYPEGGHGLGLAPESPHVATWMELCIQWLESRGWIFTNALRTHGSITAKSEQ